MALNGSVSVEATPKGQDLLVFSWSAVQDAAANTSTVNWMMQLVASTAGAINGVPVERDWTVTVDGQEFTGTANVNISNNETKTLATGEIVLEHAEDGTRSFAFAFSQDFSINWVASSQFIGTISGSGTGELDAIAEPEPKKFDIKGFAMRYISSLCGRPVQWPKRKPVAFLYGPDKVRLPDIYRWYTPEIQKTHPYALIIHYPFDDGTSLSLLHVFSNPLTAIDITDEYGYVSVQVLEDGGTYMEWVYRSDEYTDWMGANILVPSDNWETRTTRILWANTTIYLDGDICIEESVPVPVYE